MMRVYPDSVLISLTVTRTPGRPIRTGTEEPRPLVASVAPSSFSAPWLGDAEIITAFFPRESSTPLRVVGGYARHKLTFIHTEPPERSLSDDNRHRDPGWARRTRRRSGPASQWSLGVSLASESRDADVLVAARRPWASPETSSA